jgi:hypothetical protein
VEASITVISASDSISRVFGKPATDVRQISREEEAFRGWRRTQVNTPECTS